MRKLLYSKLTRRIACASYPKKLLLYSKLTRRIACARSRSDSLRKVSGRTTSLDRTQSSLNRSSHNFSESNLHKHTPYDLPTEMKSRKEINRQNYQRKRDSIKAKYIKAQRKSITPQLRGNSNTTQHIPQLRGNLRTSNRNQQVPKRSAMSSFVIVVLDLHLHLHLTKQTSSFQLRSENR